MKISEENREFGANCLLTAVLTAGYVYALYGLKGDYTGYRFIEGGSLAEVASQARDALTVKNIDSGRLVELSGLLVIDSYRTEYDPNENKIFRLYLGEDHKKDNEPYLYIAVFHKSMKDKFTIYDRSPVTVRGRLKSFFPDKTVHLFITDDCDIFSSKK